MYEIKKITWSEAYATGDANIDFQHKYLFESLNRLGDWLESDVDVERLRVILGRLHFYAQWHFNHEENCMEKHRCPVLAQNKRAHGFFMKMLNGYLIDIEKHDRLKELAVIVHADLAMWLSEHILKIDTQLKNTLAETTDNVDLT